MIDKESKHLAVDGKHIKDKLDTFVVHEHL